MARIRTGNPNGRPAKSVEGKTEITTSITLAVDVIEKIDRMRKGNETRRNFIEQIVRELAE